jgi:hypothetical protein
VAIYRLAPCYHRGQVAAQAILEEPGHEHG